MQIFKEAKKVNPLTKTSKFKNWFSGSKAVDKNGKPLILFHGTRDAITKFSPKRIGTISNFAGSWQVDRYGIFLAEDPKLAEEYATQDNQTENANIMPVYLKALNPIDLRENLSNALFDKIEEKFGRDAAHFIDIRTGSSAWELFDADPPNDPVLNIKIFKFLGFDSAIIYEDSEIENGTTWVAFEPNQIKSAIYSNFGEGDELNEIADKNSNKMLGLRYRLTPSSEVFVMGCAWKNRPLFAKVLSDDYKSALMLAKRVVKKERQNFLDEGAAFGDNDYQNIQFVEYCVNYSELGRIKLNQVLDANSNNFKEIIHQLEVKGYYIIYLD